MKSTYYHLALLALLSSGKTLAAPEPVPVMEQNQTAIQWNQYANHLVKLNQSILQKTPHTKKTRVGGYSGTPNFFNETRYFRATTDLHISTVQWEKEHPERLHSIEVKLFDKQGRVSRDFSAAYLVKHRNAPIQTLTTLHYYNDKLHGFRSFDASDNRLYEVCRGSYKGKKVHIDLDDDYGELSEALEKKDGIMNSESYKACFGSRKVDKNQLKLPEL